MIVRSLAATMIVCLFPAGLRTALAGGHATIEIPGLRHKVELIRDSNGIPHVMAQTEHDLLFVQGWVHAEDRLFQMDLLRRQAGGTLAELLGPLALLSDIELRIIGLRRAAERSLPRLSRQTQAGLEAYAEGVNAWVASHALPPEYDVLELTSYEPWTPLDTVAISKLIAFSLSFEVDIPATQTLLACLGAGEALGFDGAALYFEDLFRAAPFDSAATVPDAAGTTAVRDPRRLRPASGAGRGRRRNPRVSTMIARDDVKSRGWPATRIPAATMILADSYLRRIAEIPILSAAAHPRERETGSNEWAISGRLTASGRPILANDPHLPLDTPAVFYQIHLVARRPSIDVIGSSFAGVPYVILGQNRRIAWGATTNSMDVTDTFQEEIVEDAASPSGISTVYQGAREPVIRLPATFRINPLDGIPDNLAIVPPGNGVPESILIVPRRSQGPLIAVDVAAGVGLSIQYTGFSGTREADSFRTWNLAANLDDFRAGLETFDFGSQNWCYVDVEGNIAHFTSGELPLREDLESGAIDGLPPAFIRDGTGGNEWLPVSNPLPGQAVPHEILPAEEMPHVVNPRGGWFVNANNDPAGTTLDNDPLNQSRPGGGIYYLGSSYSGGFRAGRITRALREVVGAGPVTRDDLRRIQADVRLLDAEIFTPYILAAFAHASAGNPDATLAGFVDDPGIAEAVRRLGAWDYSTPTGVPEGYDAADVDGQRLPPSAQEIEASVAATIYSVWRGQIVANVIDATVDALGLPRPGGARSLSALRHLLETFETAEGTGASGIPFFNVPGVADAATRRDILILRSLEDTLELLAGPAFEAAFGGSTDQNDYRWGRLHRVTFDHPLDEVFSIPPAGNTFPASFDDLPGLATDGGFGVVDASAHGVRARSWNEFIFSAGPARRYVGGPDRGRRIRGETSLPGGESGVPGSPWYVNLLGEWLTNETHAHLQRMAYIRRETTRKTLLMPARS